MLKLATKFPPQAAALETAYRAGFRHAELWLDSAILRHTADAIRVCRDFPFTYALHFPNRADRDPAVLQGAVDLYRGLDCRCMVIHRPMYDRFAADLHKLDAGVCLAVENHKLDPDGFETWARESPALTLDVEHLWLFTLRNAPLPEVLASLSKFLERHGDKLRHVHLPGYWPGSEEHRPMYASREFVFPVLTQLAEMGFGGLIVSEVHTEFQNLVELQMDVLLFHRWRELQASTT